MILGKKGQIGFLGEDMLYVLAAMLAVVTILIVSVKAFTDFEDQMQRIDVFREALIKADVAATQLSAQSQGKDIRLIDEELAKAKLTGGGCGAICSGCAGLAVIDLETKKEYVCGLTPEQAYQANPKAALATVRLPIAIKISGKRQAPDEYNPGILQATISR